MKRLCVLSLTLVGVFILASCTSTGNRDATALPSGIPTDDRIITGELANGLSYYILENDRPANKAELRLVVNAGSTLEDEDQRGLAHFLEHMAFNGTEKYPENDLIAFLQEIGMEFGPDINAYTSFDETVYMLSVPTDQDGRLEQGIEVLEEWAFNISLTEEEVIKEQGVVLDEWRLGRGANQRILDRILPLLFAQSQYAQRLPIGLEEVIKTADVERLRRFYRDWYRPDLMAVIAVGDFNAEDVRREIERRFSPYDNPEAPRERVDFEVPYLEEEQFAFESDPELSVTAVEILNRFEPQKINSADDYKGLLVGSIFYSMINQRLAEIAQRENPPFLTASAYQSNYTRSTAHSGITALVAPSAIESGLAALASEYARIEQFGFLQSELDRSRRNLQAGFESFWKDRDNREHREFLGSLQDNFLTGTPLADLDWEWEQVQRILPQISLEDFTPLINERLADADRLVIVSGPSEIDSFEISASTASSVINQAKAVALEPWVDNSRDDPLVKVVPLPGEVVQETSDEDAGIIEWTMSNGARVFLKPTDFKEDEILFSAFSPGGLSLIDDADYISGSLASTLAQVSGLGDFNSIDLNKVLSGINVSIAPYINQYEEGLNGASTPQDFETLLKLNYLHFTGARLDESAWASYSGRLEEFLRNQELDPLARYQNRINEVLFNGNLRARGLKAEDIQEVDPQKAIELFRQRFSDGGDFSFVFTGAFDPDEIRPLIELWIGGIPSPGIRESARDNGMDYFPENLRSELYAGIEQNSRVTQIWHGLTPWTYDNLYDMAALTAALNIILIEEVREAIGGTYSIFSTFSIDSVPEEDYRIIVQFSSEPERVDELISLVNDIIANIGENGIEQRYVDSVSESQKLNFRENLERNNWWDAQIKFLIREDLDWRYATDKDDWYNALSTDDIQAAVNRWMIDSTYGEIILFPEGDS